KFEELSERFSAIEKHVDEQDTERQSTSLEESQNNNSEENKFQEIGSKSYYIENNEKATWTGALVKCLEMKAHLVSLQDEEEWMALMEILRPDRSYWTDINDREEELEFRSKTTGRRSPFLRWDEDEPNSAPGAEDCVELRSEHGFRMNDVSCEDHKYFIC
ncbi:hypothetical protein KR038_003622, partial [Drosophila bunnanda]